MIRESGVVVEVKDGVARITMHAGEHGKCASCGLCRLATEGKVLLDAPSPGDIRVGDQITVEIPVPNAALSAIIVMLIPLTFFVGGIILGEWLTRRGSLPGGSGTSILIGLTGMCLAFSVAVMYDRHLRRDPLHQPRIVEWPSHSAE